MPPHGKKKHICGICKRGYSKKYGLNCHIKAVHEGKRIPCSYDKCSSSFVQRKSLQRHVKKEHEGKRWVCSECGKVITSSDGLKKHEASHNKPAQFPCPEGCGKSFARKQSLENHIKSDHEGLRFICEQEGCGRPFKLESSLKAHIQIEHQDIKNHVCETCGKNLSSKGNLTRHATTHKKRIPCPKGCGRKLAGAYALRQHIDAVHHGNYFHCEEDGCDSKYTTNRGLVQHVKEAHKGIIHQCSQCERAFTRAYTLKEHEKFTHGELSFPCMQPGCDTVCRRPGILQSHILFVHAKRSFFCGEDGCDKTFDGSCYLEDHVKSVHGGKTYPCKHKAKFGCDEIFTSQAMATYHSRTHYLWLCKFPRCMANLQQRKMIKACMSRHYRTHIERGQCLEGEFNPLKVIESNPVDTENTRESGILADESIREDAEDVDQDGILPEESVMNDLAPAGQTLLDALEKPRKGQAELREELAAQTPRYKELNLRCPGPGIVLQNIVQGTEVCPKKTIITPQNGVLYRRANNNDRINLKSRCSDCQAQHEFESLLTFYELQALPGQTQCSHTSCVQPLFKGTRFCMNHFRAWVPETLGRDQINELQDLFLKAASTKWEPFGDIAKRFVGRVGSNKNAVLDILSIDLEYSTKRRQIYQVGISDIKGDKLLDCFPQYSAHAMDQLFSRSWSNSFSQSFQEIPYKLKMWEMNEKYRGKGFALDGTLNASKVTEKLGKFVNKDKTFVAWGTSPFDVAYVREWLDTEGVDHSLPADDTVLLLYREFQANLSEKLGSHCFKGRFFPLKLEVLFTVLYQGHDLVGLNHDALLDARQLSMLVRLFMDLCKSPHERLLFKGVLPIIDHLDKTVFCGMNSPIRQFGSTPSIKTHLQPEAKRQREMKESSPNKRSRLG